MTGSTTDATCPPTRQLPPAWASADRHAEATECRLKLDFHEQAVFGRIGVKAAPPGDCGKAQ